MNWLQLRFSSGENDTLGAIFMVSHLPRTKDSGTRLEKTFRCFALEDERREVKIPGRTRIPAGIYEIKKRRGSPAFAHYDERFAPWHDGMLWLQDVPGFDWIYIHPGNSHDHTEGCILVGDGVMQNVAGDGRLLESISAYERIYKEIGEAMNDAQRVFWEVRDAA